ncbi:hypothetical protein RFI_09905 [Reticulomyxa filosa]|uniref:Uncharacterized protein n=1 Tax=Reticulomyxa filosa TaxID=46433 RepID=X6NMR6_RETFI|nr:hypothetical protein RFI_09905 [Reticulomyxa filosa]|eukprot:ETO27228.1 hypothetical protein RFI_09905 [Reticulomyxa filosa]
MKKEKDEDNDENEANEAEHDQDSKTTDDANKSKNDSGKDATSTAPAKPAKSYGFFASLFQGRASAATQDSNNATTTNVPTASVASTASITPAPSSLGNAINRPPGWVPPPPPGPPPPDIQALYDKGTRAGSDITATVGATSKRVGIEHSRTDTSSDISTNEAEEDKASKRNQPSLPASPALKQTESVSNAKPSANDAKKKVQKSDTQDSNEPKSTRQTPNADKRKKNPSTSKPSAKQITTANSKSKAM